MYDNCYSVVNNWKNNGSQGGSSFKNQLPEWTIVCTASLISGSMEAILTPFERIQVVMATPKYNQRFPYTIQAIVEVFKIGGFMEFYRGSSIILFRNGLSTSMFFTLRNYLESSFSQSTVSPVSHLLEDFIYGAALGCTISCVFFPVNVLKNKVQSEIIAKGTTAPSFNEVFEAIMKERQGKVRLLYRGLSTNVTRSLVSWGLTNSIYGYLKKSFGTSSLSPGEFQ